MTIIQLVSEQTMQNVLAPLVTGANRLIHVLSTERFESAANHTVDAVKQAGNPIESVANVILKEPMPSIESVVQAVEAEIRKETENGREPIVNFTGGTKLMSIGAWMAARKTSVPSVYVDTQSRRFVDGETSEAALDSLLDQGDLTFEAVQKKLQVHVVAKANGCERVTGGMDFHPYVSLTEMLLADSELEASSHAAIRGRGGLLDIALGSPNWEARDANQVLHLLETPIPNLPDDIGRAAAAAGLLREMGNEWFIDPVSTGVDVEAIAHRLISTRLGREEYRKEVFSMIEGIQFPMNFLSGAWVEVAAASRMESSGKFRDIRWSVHAGDRRGYDPEEDVVALDGPQIVYVSCKRGGSGRDRLIAHTEEINARAERLGGRFTRRYYVIHRMPYAGVLDSLEKRCRELGNIRLIGTSDLRDGNPFE